MALPLHPPPSSSPSPAHSSPAPSSSRSAQQAIQHEAQRLLRGYPVAAGMQGLGDVVSHLPPITPSPTSFFPPAHAPSHSLHPASAGLVPSDPLFDTYARELSALMGGPVGGATRDEVERYRASEVGRLLGSREIREQVQSVSAGVARGGSYADLPPLQAPFAFSTVAPVPHLAPDASFASHLFQASAFPLPPPPTSASITSVPPFPPPSSSAPSAPIDAFVADQLARAQAAAAAASAAAMQRSNSSSSRSQSGGASGSGPSTPSASSANAANGYTSGRIFQLPTPSRLPPLPQPGIIPTSSPDPLAFIPSAAAGPSKPKVSLTTGGMRYSAEHPLGKKRSSASLAGSGSPTKPPREREREHSFELVIPVSPKTARKTSGSKGAGKGKKPKPEQPEEDEDERDEVDMLASSQETPRASQSQHHSLGAPFAGLDSGTGGVSSGMKRFKLDSGAVGKTPGTGASGAGKTSVVEKVDDLLADVFAADDAFVLDTSSAATGAAPDVHRSPSRRAGTSAAAGEAKYFRTTAVAPSSSLPLLHTDVLKTLLRHVRTVAAKGKAEELLEAVEEGGVGRLLRVLERSWDGVEGWEGWEREAGRAREDGGAVETVTKGKGKKGSPAKGAAGKKGKGKKKAAEEEDDDEDETPSSPGRAGTRRSSRTPSPSRPPPPSTPSSSQLSAADAEGYWTGARLSFTQRQLRALSDALLALRLALELLDLPLPPAHPLPKHLFSADYLSALIASLRKGALEAAFLPLLEAPPTSPLSELVSGAEGGSHTREQIADVVDGVQGAVDALARLVRREDLGEEPVISLAYLGLEPFFHDAPLPSSGSKAKAPENAVTAALKGLRMASLGLVQAVYGRYAEQRQWVLEEVLGNLGKGEQATGGKGGKQRGAIRLRTGASIQTISALLLHLVQTPPASLHAAVRRKLAAADRVDENGDSQMQEAEDELGLMARGVRLTAEDEGGEDGAEEEDGADVLASISRRLLDPAAESAQKAARTIIGFLLQRSAKAGKTASGTADSEYRAVFDHLIQDLLATVHLPEWPAAEVLLSVCCRSMMATLADPKSTHEGNSLKGLALEHLGPIVARIRQDVGTAGPGGGLREAVARGDVGELDRVFAGMKSVVEHVARGETASGTSESSSTFTRLGYARDLLAALEQAQAAAASASQDSEAGEAARAVVERLELLAREIWEEGEGEDVFGPSPEEAQPRIDAVALDLFRSSQLVSMYDPLLERIVDASESAQVTLRTKALRAISLVVAQDPGLFHQANIRRSIENRMLDASPAVRDASIELVGKYVVQRPDLAVEYLPKLGERISDTGLSVRRRVVKLLKVLYGVVEDEERKIDICRRLVYRVLDEDDGIRDLAVDAIEDLWFGHNGKTASHDSPAEIAKLAQVVLQTTGSFRDRPPPVDDALRLIMAKHAEKGTTAPLERVKAVMESLINGLVEDDSEMDVVAAVKTVHVLSGVDASLLSTSKATLLLPFLKSATTPEEQAISDHLLKVFRAAVLTQPKTASKFGKDLQAALVPMLNKPSQNVLTLQGVVACFCAAVHSQTQDYGTMVRVFGVTLKRLIAEAQKLVKPETAKTVNTRQLPVLCYMTSLLCEHGQFDQVREEQPDVKPQIDSISVNSIAELVFNTLVRIHSLELPAVIKTSILTSLGFLYRAHPTLMLHANSTAIIDAIFESPNPAMHVQVLKIIQDFLASQERASTAASAQPAKKKKVEQGVKMEELVGNVEGFADSGVASAIAQRYLKRIIDSALSTNVSLQRLGIDLISTITRSGFSHPITLSPTLVALTACSDAQIAAKAYSSLALIHQKHASLLATRFLEPARAAYDFVKASSAGQPARGHRGDPPDSMLGRWFALLHKEKRQVQLDYLKTLARSFEVEAGATCSEDGVSFARFIAEALSTFDYKRNEEPLLVISYLNSALAVTGLQVLHHLEQDLAGGGGLLAMAEAGRAGTASPKKSGSAASLDASATNDSAEKAPSADLARQSVISGLALLLRDHLKHVYSITDAKLAKYVVGKKSAMGDKAVTRRAEAPLALGLDGYHRMPFALQALKTEVDFIAQRETYRRLIAEDGTIGALEELEHDEDDA